MNFVFLHLLKNIWANKMFLGRLVTAHSSFYNQLSRSWFYFTIAFKRSSIITIEFPSAIAFEFLLLSTLRFLITYEDSTVISAQLASQPANQPACSSVRQCNHSLQHRAGQLISQLAHRSDYVFSCFIFSKKSTQFCSKICIFLKKYSQNGVRTKIKNCSWSRLKSHPHVVWFSRRFLMSLSRAGLKIFTKTESELISISGWFLRREYSKMKNQFY